MTAYRHARGDEREREELNGTMATYVTGDTHGNGYDLAERMLKAGMQPGDTIIIDESRPTRGGSHHSATVRVITKVLCPSA